MGDYTDASGDLFDRNVFLITESPWCVEDSNNGTLVASTEKDKIVAPVFTSADLAEKFVKQLGITDLRAVKIGTPQNWLAWLEKEAAANTTHISFDRGTDKVRPWPIAVFIREAKEYIREHLD